MPNCIESRFNEARDVYIKMSSEQKDGLFRLYGLFKQISVGICDYPMPPSSQPILRSKWDAWVGAKDVPKEEAMDEFAVRVENILYAQAGYSSSEVQYKGPLFTQWQYGSTWDDEESTVVLEGTQLLVFANPADTKPSRTIEIARCTFREGVVEEIKQLDVFTFSLIDRGIKINLGSRSPYAVKTWEIALKAVMQAAPISPLLVKRSSIVDDFAAGGSLSNDIMSNNEHRSAPNENSSYNSSNNSSSSSSVDVNAAPMPTAVIYDPADVLFNVPLTYHSSIEASVRTVLAAVDDATKESSSSWETLQRESDNNNSGRCSGSGGGGGEGMDKTELVVKKLSGADCVAVCGETVVNACITDVFRTLIDSNRSCGCSSKSKSAAADSTTNTTMKRKKTVFTNHTEHEILLSYSPNSWVEYTAFVEDVWPTTPRDFVSLVHWRMLDDGSIIITYHAVKLDAFPASIDGYIRGEIKVAGFVLRPNVSSSVLSSSSFAGTRIQYLVECDGVMPYAPESSLDTAGLALVQPLVILNDLLSMQEMVQAMGDDDGAGNSERLNRKDLDTHSTEQTPSLGLMLKRHCINEFAQDSSICDNFGNSILLSISNNEAPENLRLSSMRMSIRPSDISSSPGGLDAGPGGERATAAAAAVSEVQDSAMAKNRVFRVENTRENMPASFTSVLAAACDRVHAVFDSRANSSLGWSPWFDVYGVVGKRIRNVLPIVAVYSDTIIVRDLVSTFKLIMDQRLYFMADPQTKKRGILKTYSDHTWTERLVYKRCWPAAARDILRIVHWRVLVDSSIIVIFCSESKDEDGHLQQEKHQKQSREVQAVSGEECIRGHVEYGGYRITSMGGGRTRVQYVTKMDLCAAYSLPTVDSIARNQANHVVALHNCANYEQLSCESNASADAHGGSGDEDHDWTATAAAAILEPADVESIHDQIKEAVRDVHLNINNYFPKTEDNDQIGFGARAIKTAPSTSPVAAAPPDNVVSTPVPTTDTAADVIPKDTILTKPALIPSLDDTDVDVLPDSPTNSSHLDSPRNGEYAGHSLTTSATAGPAVPNATTIGDNSCNRIDDASESFEFNRLNKTDIPLSSPPPLSASSSTVDGAEKQLKMILGVMAALIVVLVAYCVQLKTQLSQCINK